MPTSGFDSFAAPIMIDSKLLSIASEIVHSEKLSIQKARFWLYSQKHKSQLLASDDNCLYFWRSESDLYNESAVLLYQKINETYFIQFEYLVLGLFWIVYVCTLAIGWTYAFGEKAWTTEDIFQN